MEDDWRKEEKLSWFSQNNLNEVQFDNVTPDKRNNWINMADNDWETMISVCSKDVKAGKSIEAIFEFFSLGVITARDEWVYDNNELELSNKVNSLIYSYNADVEKHHGKTKDEIKNAVDYSIKWTRAVKNDLYKGIKYQFDEALLKECLYRPFVKRQLYFSKQLNEMQYQLDAIFYGNNISINFLSVDSSNELATLVSNELFDYCLLKKGNGGTQSLPIYYYNKKGDRKDNITDWALGQFKKHYQGKENSNSQAITKESIFNYVYAVMHNPAYRKKYELNLKREFPRIPMYEGFWKWTKWGEQLISLHINYEDVESYELIRTEIATKDNPKAKLRTIKESGVINLDENTELHGIPKIAWEYKLGNRSALEWILDQYKEKKPSDPNIAEKFNTYRFADYKEKVIALLMKVCTVSVETMKVVEEMTKTNGEHL
jgi:predicted helicase